MVVPLAFMGLGGPELLLVLVVILVLFGGKRMPEIAKGLGRGLHEFRRAMSEAQSEIKGAVEEEPRNHDDH